MAPQCSNGNADGVPCGWTGSVATPAPPAGGTSLAEFGTSETTALTNAGAQSPSLLGSALTAPKRPSNQLDIRCRAPVDQQHVRFGQLRRQRRPLPLGLQGHRHRNNELPESFAALAGYNV